MGLDIYFHHTARQFDGDPSNIEDITTFLQNDRQSDSYNDYTYFRKVNFLFSYFEPKMVDEYFSFVTRDDVRDIITRCRAVLANHDLASELLPTRAGFFFGSTEYDEWYFSDVKECMEKMFCYLPVLKQTGYVVFSW